MSNVRTYTMFSNLTNDEIIRLAMSERDPLLTELVYRLEEALSFRYMVEETLDGRG